MGNLGQEKMCLGEIFRAETFSATLLIGKFLCPQKFDVPKVPIISSTGKKILQKMIWVLYVPIKPIIRAISNISLKKAFMSVEHIMKHMGKFIHP